MSERESPIPNEPFSIIRLPVDVLAIVFAQLPKRSVLLILSLICKRFRAAVYRRVTSLSVPPGVSASVLARVLPLLPHLAHLTLRDITGQLTLFSLPPSLRSLSFVPSDIHAAAAQISCLSSLCPSLTSLTINTSSAAMDVAPFLFAASSSLTSLSIFLGSYVDKALCPVLGERFRSPSLRSLSLLGASTILFPPELVTAHALQLTSLTMSGTGCRFVLSWLARCSLPNLQEFYLETDNIAADSLCAVISASSPSLRLVMAMRDPRWWDGLTMLQRNAIAKCLVGIYVNSECRLTHRHPYTRLAAIHDTFHLPSHSLWNADLQPSLPLIRNLSVIVSNAHPQYLATLSILTTLTTLRLDADTQAVTQFRHTTLTELNVSTKFSASLIALTPLSELFPALARLTLNVIFTERERRPLIIALLSLLTTAHHLDSLFVPAFLYNDVTVLAHLREFPWTNVRCI